MTLKGLPIQRKLVGFVFLTTILVVIVSYLLLLAYETRTSKNTTTRNLVTVGSIIASNSTAALQFDDPKLAREILSGLRAEPDITAAALYDKTGRLYATYPSSLAPSAVPEKPAADGSSFNFRELTLQQPVAEGESRVGTLFLRSDLGDMYRRLSVYGLVLLGMLGGSALLAYFLSVYLQRQVSGPILALADAARVISDRKDYSVRAKKTSDDELGFLTDSFNSMLEHIQLNLAALQESDKRFRVVADSAPVLIWVSDEKGQFGWFNKHWLEFVGRVLEQEQGEGWREGLHPEDRARVEGDFLSAMAARSEFRCEYRLRRYDGAYRWVFDRGVPRYQGEEFAGYIGSCVDIHDRKEAEAAARSSEMQMRLVTDHASVFLCQLDTWHRYKFVNRAYATRYGLEPAEMIGRHLSEIIGTESYAIAKARIESTLAGKREEFEVLLPYPKLGPRWVHLVNVPERALDGTVVGLISVLDDTTERRKTEKEIERARDEAVAASRAKDDFLAALSHELRTPLSPVLLLASEAAANPDVPKEARADFETIRKNVELEARLIDDLLDLTSITRGKLALDLRPLDALTVVRDALATIEADMAAKQISLVQRLPVGSVTVLGDPVRLQQVFWNVFKNAVKFTPHGGKITVESSGAGEDGSFTVRVTDTGIGMVAEEISRVFEAFAQGNHALEGGSHRFGGLGLGLAISRKVMELHSGRISVASAGRDLGCTFTIEVPLARPHQLDPAQAASLPEALASPPTWAAQAGDKIGTILLVEDHAPTRAAIGRLLERRRYRVVAAGSVSEARAIAEREKIDLVVSDIGLPDGTGYELMVGLRDKYRLKGIALTGYGMEGDITRSQIAGFLIHLIKPVSVQALDDALLMITRWPEQN